MQKSAMGRSFCIGDVEVTQFLLSEDNPRIVKAIDLYGAAPMLMLASTRWLLGTGSLRRGVSLHQSGRQTVPTALTSRCKNHSVHATASNHV